VDDKSTIQRAAEALAGAEAMLIGAGAGMGVDSGLPDFRGTEGFWRAYPPFGKLGLRFEDMANPEWFESDPHLAWGFYGHRLHLYRNTEPHRGFEILRKWGESMHGGYFVFTSNVDGQFQKAGFQEQNILECHGTIHHLQCASPCRQRIWNAKDVRITVNETTFRAHDRLPLCPACRGVARPNILMFGDWGWISARTDSQQASFREWLGNIDRTRLVVVECGAGTAISTVRSTCERAGGTLVRINPREPQIRGEGLSLAIGAAEALERIDELVRT